MREEKNSNTHKKTEIETHRSEQTAAKQLLDPQTEYSENAAAMATASKQRPRK
jgi:hypothetical protein